MMPAFEYTVSKDGIRSQGQIEAPSSQEAAARLRGDGILVLSIRPGSMKKGFLGSGPVGAPAGPLARWRVPKAKLETSLRQLASLLKAGVPIMTALHSLEEHTTGTLRRCWAGTREAVRRGTPLSRSLKHEMPFLDQVTIGLLAVGEANGTLDNMAAFSASLMERARKLRTQIMQAFAYPALVCVGALAVGYYMVSRVFPVVMEFIKEQGSGVALPLPTRILIGLNDFLTLYGVYILAAIVIVPVLLAILRRTPGPDLVIGRTALAIPLLGGAFQFYANTMWCMMLSATLGSGLDAIRALKLVQGTMSNRFYVEQFDAFGEYVRRGSGLGKAMGNTALRRLCPMAHTMISVSEQSGGLEENLRHVSEYYEDQLSRRVTLLSKLVEPAVFVFVGGLVGLVYFGFFMAVMAAQNAAGGT